MGDAVVEANASEWLPATILLVEDDPDDAELTRIALSEMGLVNRLHVVGDGSEALLFLKRRPPWEDAPRVDLVLVDLNLPRMGGLDLLKVMKEDPDIRHIPAVVLSISSDPEDVLASFAEHADGYMVKPIDRDQLCATVESLTGFALAVVCSKERTRDVARTPLDT
ncbi:MAG: two-component system response regulator [Acidimicrobiales bacterium]|nr:MAG: two-component system response regulator [Acidimicrobiales bacterium]